MLPPSPSSVSTPPLRCRGGEGCGPQQSIRQFKSSAALNIPPIPFFFADLSSASRVLSRLGPGHLHNADQRPRCAYFVFCIVAHVLHQRIAFPPLPFALNSQRRQSCSCLSRRPVAPLPILPECKAYSDAFNCLSSQRASRQAFLARLIYRSTPANGPPTRALLAGRMLPTPDALACVLRTNPTLLPHPHRTFRLRGRVWRVVRTTCVSDIIAPRFVGPSWAP